MTVKTIEVAEMWFFRKMQRISHMERMTNEEGMRRRVRETRTLSHNIRQEQATFLGHVMRKDLSI